MVEKDLDDAVVEIPSEKSTRIAVVKPVKRPVVRLIVGYTLKPIDNVEKYAPAGPTIDETLSDAEKQVMEREQADRLASFYQKALLSPHMATFDVVRMLDASTVTTVRYTTAGRGQGGRPTICKSIWSWLRERYPYSWLSEDKWPEKTIPPRVLVMGFRPDIFLHILAMECSLPENNCRLPISMWYPSPSPNTWDVEAALFVNDPPDIGWQALLRRRWPVAEADAAVWEQVYGTWQGPGHDADIDHNLTMEIAGQLGFLRD
jgi:hypothetical protein